MAVLSRKPVREQGFNGCFRDISVEEFIVRADFNDLKAFLHEICGELSKLFVPAVGIDDHADVLVRVICGDAEIV